MKRVPFEVKSEHSPKTLMRLWDKKVVPLNSKNRGAYSLKNCYFGQVDGENVEVFYHKEGQGIHMVPRFQGTIKGDMRGSVISGYIGKAKTTEIFLIFMMIVMAVVGVIMLVNRQLQPGLVLFVLAAVAAVLLFTNGREDILRVEKLLKDLAAADTSALGAEPEKKPAGKKKHTVAEAAAWRSPDSQDQDE